MSTTDSPNPPDPSASNRDLWRWTTLVVLFVGGVLTWQSHTLGLTTDEVTYIQCHEKLTRWLADISKEGIAKNFTPERLREGWYFGQFYNKNLPLIGIVSLFSETLSGEWETPPASYRWGNVLLFSATCGLIFRWVARSSSLSAGLIAVAAIIGIPRLTANAALLSLDPLIGCLWIWGTWCLTQADRGWRFRIGLGVIAGLGFATKPTFWFMIPVWVLWGIFHYRKNSWKFLSCLCLAGGLTAYAVLPMWWNDPIGGLWSYWKLLKAEEGWQGVDAYYLGTAYQVAGQGKAPWHAVLILTLVTTPVWILVLWVAGIAQWVRMPRENQPRFLWGSGLMILPVVMMLPGTPCHDGIRMFLPSFLFSGMLAAAGGEFFLDRWSEFRNRKRPIRSQAGISSSLSLKVSVMILCASTVPLAGIHPAGLSYYNFLTGGLQGATAAGKPNSSGFLSSSPTFEATYWWEVMTIPAWKQMQSHIPAGGAVWVYPDFIGKEMLRSWGVIRADLKFAGTPREADSWLLYGRMGRLMQPESHPMDVFFQTMPALWEQRVDGARLVVLIKKP